MLPRSNIGVKYVEIGKQASSATHRPSAAARVRDAIAPSPVEIALSWFARSRNAVEAMRRSAASHRKCRQVVWLK
jgi:hypothetical protein